jgi:hypothetical protein
VSCIEPSSRVRRPWRCVLSGGCVLMLALAGCSNSPTSGATSPGASTPSTSSAPAPGRASGAAPSSSGKAPAAAPQPLGPPKTPRSHAELRRQAAQRLVAANPDRTYTGTVPDVLLAIPVLEVELTADGHVRHVKVLRRPGQALDTVQLAIDAVHRAAPFGNVAGLPRPWVFSETFLFNDQRRFKPRTLDE